MVVTITDIPSSGPIAFVEAEDLAAAALPSGGAGGNSLYDASPGDGSWAAAPNAGAEATVTPPFTASSFTVLVRAAAVEVRISSDGATYGDWVVLDPGSHAFELIMETIQVREDVDNGGAEYQVVSFA